jgi:hypothetical protein
LLYKFLCVHPAMEVCSAIRRYIAFWVFPDAGAKLGATTTTFEDIREAQEGRNETQYGPFGDEEMWEVAKFMVDYLGQGEADRFLKLPCVCLVLPSCRFSSY